MSEFKTMRANDLPKKNFTMVSRDAHRDRTLSYKARGVLGDVIDRAEGTPVSAEWLADRGTEGRDAMRGALGELREKGYARLVKMQAEGGRWESRYEFTDVPGQFCSEAAGIHAQQDVNAQVAPDAEIPPPVNAKPQVAPDAGLPTVGEPTVGKPTAGEPPLTTETCTAETPTTETSTTETQTENSPPPVPPPSVGDLVARGREEAGATREDDFSAGSVDAEWWQSTDVVERALNATSMLAAVGLARPEDRDLAWGWAQQSLPLSREPTVAEILRDGLEGTGA
jgi:hypothetical protein